MTPIKVSEYKAQYSPEGWLSKLVESEGVDAVLVRGNGESRFTYALITTETTLSNPNFLQQFNNIQNRLKMSGDFTRLLEFVAQDSDLEVIRKDIETELAKDASIRKVTYNDSPEKRYINDLALSALKMQVSDIHVFSEDGVAEIVFERHGILKVWKETTSDEADAMINAGLMSFSPNYIGHGDTKEQISATIPLALYESGNEPVAHVTIRVVRDMADSGTHTVMRINDSKTIAKSMDELGVAADIQKMLRAIIAKNDGMLIITGPTGQGKTTTLNALLAGVTAERKIIYAADPVEGSLGRPYVVSYSVDDSSPTSSYESRIKIALRQAPRIVCIAEARTSDVLKSAFGAALTGHFCGTTYHAADTFSALIRILDDGIPASLLASGVLNALASQRLVKKLCPSCKKSHKHPVYGSSYIRNKDGCKQCDELGVIGRVNVAEVLMIDDHVCELIIKGDIPAIKKHAQNNGFRSMADRALELIKDGEIDPYDAVESVPGMAYQSVYKYPATKAGRSAA